MKTSKAIKWVLFWIGLALLFNVGVYIFKGQQSALEFFGGYIIELSLSVDNLFLFLLVFSSFGIPAQYQRRILTYGIAGAIILRLLFIIIGAKALETFTWIIYIFGLLLIISGIRMAVNKEKSDFSKSKLIALLNKIMPVKKELDGEKFFTRENNKLLATPLFAVLILIEGSDIIFAVDSIPAIFSITTNIFIVATSNIFAIMGLRSLYFVLEKLHESFIFVKYGVSCILTFTGIKLLILAFGIHIDVLVSIGIIIFILAVSVISSVIYTKRHKKHNL